MADSIIVWHRTDLRIPDNPAINQAATDGRPIPVYVFDPTVVADRPAGSDARVEFCLQSLEDLKARYRDRGSDLLFFLGEPQTVLTERFDAPIYYNRSVTAQYHGWTVPDGDQFHGFVADAIRRETEQPRDGWQENAESYFETEVHSAPQSLPEPQAESEISVAALRNRWSVSPDKHDVPQGGRSAALDRLNAFIESIESYPESISPPAVAEQHCSRVSQDFVFGTISPREAYRVVTDRAPSCRGRELFLTRLFWNQHFKQKLADFPQLTEQAVNPVYRGLHRDEHDPDLVTAWKRGQTGFPLVDASMRALAETGYLNFRMRALCATFFCHILREWWKRGADHFYAHLVDADPGINYAQWQMQAGLVGVHPLRIYDPAKNTREYDADGEFIRRYVPELRAVPDAYLPRPERMAKSLQQEVGVEIGTDYPRPVVDFETRRSRTREQHARLADRAGEALSDPAVLKRASLSRRHDEIDEQTPATGQQTLTDFS